jgi:rhodanese-related sulfurtransferase
MYPVIIDVREDDEYNAEHISGSIHIPLSKFKYSAPALLRGLKNKSVILMCQGGKRSCIALDEAKSFNLPVVFEVYAGGIVEWKKLGNPVITKKENHFPIVRQVQIIAGTLVLSSSILAITVNPNFVYVCVLVGAGLIIAGFSGYCGMAKILAKMPWNR